MATVTTGMKDERESVVLIAKHDRYDITEHMDASTARRVAVELMSAAGRVERSNIRPYWP